MKETDTSNHPPDEEAADPQGNYPDIDFRALDLQDVDNDHQQASLDAGVNDHAKGKDRDEGNEAQDKGKGEDSDKGKARVLGPREAERLKEGVLLLDHQVVAYLKKYPDTEVYIHIGHTGAGKTTTISHCGMPAVPGGGIQSETSVVSAYRSPLGDIHIDTPGLDDTRAKKGNGSDFDDQTHLRRLLTFLQRTRIHHVNRIYLHCNPTNRESGLARTLVTFVRDFLRPVTEDEYAHAPNANLDHVVLLVTSFPPAEPYLAEFRRFDHVPITRNLILADPEISQSWEWIPDNHERCIVLNTDSTVEARASNARKLHRLSAASHPVQVYHRRGRCTVCLQDCDPRIMSKCHTTIARRHDEHHVQGKMIHRGEATLNAHGSLTSSRIPITAAVAAAAPEWVLLGVTADVLQELIDVQKCVCGAYSWNNFCRYTWTCCQPKTTRSANPYDDGCDNIQLCGTSDAGPGCGRETNTPGCILYCAGPECGRLQSDRNFPRMGCADDTRPHVMERNGD